MTAPLVSIGLPTYNREALLRRAVLALLGQDHPAIELVVSDNASTDGTEAFCRALAAREPRVKYFRQRKNMGATANYLEVQRRATGAYYMNMADDDTPATNYVSECVAALEADPTLAIALGRPLMSQDGVVVKDGAKTNLLSDSGADRVCAYYRTVEENVAFLGVMRTCVMRAIPPVPNTMGNDWLYMAAVAFQGKIRTIETTSILKQMGGASRTTKQIAEFLELPRIQGVLPIESIMLSAFQDVAWRNPVFAPLGAAGRWRLATRVAKTLSMRFHVGRVKKGLKRRLTGRPRAS